MKLCVWGGGGALAQEVIGHWLDQMDPACPTSVTGIVAVCRRSTPDRYQECHDYLKVVKIPGGEEHLKALGPFDALVVMPGTVMNAKLSDMSDHVWHESISGNLTAAFKALKLCLPLVKNDGSVVVVGSIVGSTGGYGCANYAAAKAGLVGLVRAAANEYAQFGIRVNLLEAGYIDCGMGA
jgi:NAD(P)-dependent dehydrogenase (short-subunit alcohol dehydrogenase family)